MLFLSGGYRPAWRVQSIFLMFANPLFASISLKWTLTVVETFDLKTVAGSFHQTKPFYCCQNGVFGSLQVTLQF